MRRALVTGGTGLVGSHLVQRLAAEGVEVRALVRDPARADWLAALGAVLVCGDVRDAAAMRDAARGCDAVLHCAAEITPVAGGWEPFRAVNLGGTAAAVAAASAAGARLLHLSSVAVYGPQARHTLAAGSALQETRPLAPMPADAWYARSKRESEAMVLAAHAEGRVWATAVRPPVITGPRDRQLIPRLAPAVARGWMPMPRGGRARVALVQARTVADLALRALRDDRAGGAAYNVAEHAELTFRALVEAMARGLGVTLHPIPVPAGAIVAGIAAVRLAAPLLPPAARAAVRAASPDWVIRDSPFRADRARQELGWSSPVTDPAGEVERAVRAWHESARR